MWLFNLVDGNLDLTLTSGTDLATVLEVIVGRGQGGATQYFTHTCVSCIYQ